VLEIVYYVDNRGEIPFEEWLDGLSDTQAIVRVMTRIERLKLGNFGDAKPLRDGVSELRIDYGAGYRLYYSMIGKRLVLLLCGGDKRKQKVDIKNAIGYLKDYKRRTG
jgi:putative addiction module killer protein